MASRPKSGNTGTRRTSTRTRKPATIDLDAKEVVSEDAKASAATSSKTSVPESKKVEPKAEEPAKPAAFGRDASPAKKAETKSGSKTEPQSTSSPSKSSSVDKPAVSSSNQTRNDEKPVAANEKRRGGFLPAIGGAVAAVVGLGAIGQIDGASNIPLIGSLYSNGSEVSATIDENRFAELVEKVEGISNDAAAATTEVDLAPLNAKVAELENLITSLSTATSEGLSVVDAALVARIEAIEAGVEGVKQDLSALGTTASSGSTADLEAAMASLNSRVDAIEGQNESGDESENLARLEGLIADISGNLETVQTATAQNSEQLNELVSQSTELKDTVASVQASEKVAKSVAVNALATALDNDDPLSLPISSVEALIGETPETQRLSELAQSGIPTLKELAASLDAFTSTIQNPSGVSEDASLSDKFWANAQSLVTFRSTGPREGDDPLAILSRVKASTVSGNLEGAKSEWQKLPVPVQENGNNWLAQLEKRLEAYSLQKEISSKLALQAG